MLGWVFFKKGGAHAPVAPPPPLPPALLYMKAHLNNTFYGADSELPGLEIHRSARTTVKRIRER